MEEDRLDCSWCGSARSIEYGICQVCLMEYPLDTKVIPLPTARVVIGKLTRRTIDLTDADADVADRTSS